MEIFIGSEKLKHRPLDIKGDLILLDEEMHYRIKNYDLMRPFFISLTSDSDIWMFICSKGGLTAGRKNADQAIFPYYTDDQLSELSENTGSKIVFPYIRCHRIFNILFFNFLICSLFNFFAHGNS